MRRNRAAHYRQGVGMGGLPLTVWVNCLLAGAAPRFPDSWMYLFTIRSLIWGVSLAALWLGLGVFTLVARVQSLVKGLRSCKPCGQKTKISFFPSVPRLEHTRFNTQSKCFLSMYLDHALLKNIYVFVCLAAPGLSCGMWTLSCGMWDFSSLTRAKTRIPCIGSVES